MSLSRFLLRRLRRYPLLWWLTVIALALLVGTTITTAMSEAQAAASKWGTTSRVLVASRDLTAGTQLSPGDVRAEIRPTAFVAGTPTADVSQRLLAVPLRRGEPLVVEKLAPAGLSRIAALLEKDERAMTIPSGDASPPVALTDRVDLIAASGESQPARLVAHSARAIDVGERSVTVAVQAEQVPQVAQALVHGTVTLAVAPLPSNPPSGAN